MFIRIFLSFIFSHLSPQSIYVVKCIEFETYFHFIVFPFGLKGGPVAIEPFVVKAPLPPMTPLS